MGTCGSPTSMNLNVNVDLELRQSHAQLHIHHRLTRYITIATIYKSSHRVKKLMGHGSTPSDPWPVWPIRISWPIWPMAHDPSTHSLLCSILCERVEETMLLNKFFPIVDACLSCEDMARQSCAMVPRWRFFGDLLGPVFPLAAFSTFQTCILNSH